MNARMIAPLGLSTLALTVGLFAAGFAPASPQGKTPEAKPAQAKPEAPKPAGKKELRASGGYSIDAVHSTVFFKIKHLNTSWSYGRFNNLSGTFNLYPDDMERSSLNVSIDVTSIDTNDEKRDGHLKSEAFFDVEQFPDANFASRSIKKTGDRKFTAEGSLMLHGVKQPLTLELEEVGAIDSEKMGVLAGFHGEFTIKRSEFGITYGPEALGDEVHVTISIEARQTDAK